MEHFCLWDHCRKLKLYNYLETLVLQETNNSFYLFSLSLKELRVLAQVFFSEIVYRINFLSFLRILWDEEYSERNAMMPFFHVHTITRFSKHLMERWLEREKSGPWLHFTSSPWNCSDAVWRLDYDCELLWHSTG